MGLADQATSKAAAAASASANGQQAALDNEGREFYENVDRWVKEMGLDVQVTFLDATRGQHPIKSSGQDWLGGHSVRMSDHTLLRVRVDDIVLAGAKAASEASVETLCARCNGVAYAVLPYGSGLGDVGKQATNPPDYYSPENCRNRFLHAVGRILRSTKLCWQCEAEVGSNCPTCHRQFTEPALKAGWV